MSTAEKTKVALFGLGYIGRMVFEAIQSENPFWNRHLELVGTVDIVPESRDWAEKKGVPSFDSLSTMIRSTQPEVCIHTTSSNLTGIVSQLKSLIESKIPVVSSCEELFFPWEQNPAAAKELDDHCQKHGVAIMGTGVNPGFIMDVLPALATQASQTVEQVTVERVVDASSRRPSLQKKIGAGLDEPTFMALVEKGRIGHVGLVESLDFLSAYMGWKLTKRGERIEPVIAPKSVKAQVVSIQKGQVCGLIHQAWGEIDRKKVIELSLRIELKAHAPGDRVFIQGNPSLKLEIEGGTPGDPATVAALMKGIPIVLQARPGIVRRLERDHFI